MSSSHFDERGNPRMVDVGAKQPTEREAVARGRVRLSREALDSILKGEVKKGDPVAVARIAGIQAAKRTPEWIPLAHPSSSMVLPIRPSPIIPTR